MTIPSEARLRQYEFVIHRAKGFLVYCGLNQFWFRKPEEQEPKHVGTYLELLEVLKPGFKADPVRVRFERRLSVQKWPPCKPYLA